MCAVFVGLTENETASHSSLVAQPKIVKKFGPLHGFIVEVCIVSYFLEMVYVCHS